MDSYHGHNNFAVFIAQNLDLIKSQACVKCSQGTPNAAEKVVANRKKVEKKKKRALIVNTLMATAVI